MMIFSSKHIYLSIDDLKSIYDDYPIGSSFDRPRYINQNWNIGDERSICVVGAIIKTLAKLRFFYW